MTVSRSLLSLCLLLVLLLIACNNSLSANPTLTSALPPLLPNMLIHVQGRVEVRRQGSIYVPVDVGTEIRPGDTLYLTEGEAAVFCGQETLWDQSPQPLRPDRENGVPCLAGRVPRRAPNIAVLRGSPEDKTYVTSDIPYILSPRSGWVSNDQPTLRWHVVSGINIYKVALLSDDGQTRPAITTTGGELVYPDAWPPLQAGGANYLLLVGGDGRQAAGQGFSLLEPGQVQELQDRAAHLRRRWSAEPGLTLLLAELYLSYGLRSETIEMLAALPNGNQVPAMQSLMGETYLAMSLFAESKTTFDRALALAQAASLPETEAAAYAGLGLAACGQTDMVGARQWWGKALARYQAMEMATRANEVEQWLANMAEACSLLPAPSPSAESIGGLHD